MFYKFTGQHFAGSIRSLSKFWSEKQMASSNLSINFRNGNGDLKSTVWLFNANNNFTMSVGPSMNHGRDQHACGIFHSSAHLGRPVIVAAGSYYKDGKKSSEIWDFTMPGSQWQSSK